VALSDFFRRTFLDATGAPSAQLVTAFAVSAGISVVIPVGLIFNRWPPESILVALLTFDAALLGLDTYLSRTKVQADNPQPASVVGTAGNVTVEQAPESQG